MSNTIVRVENLSKKYVISHQNVNRSSDRTLSGSISNGAKSIAAMITRSSDKESESYTSSQEEFWALKDISFEIKQGERVGIIGRNGAGKSTLLKILSRITEPTNGRITIQGRVASLLEVGTGFHHELSGRENIYLNGAILGMDRSEIKKKFDEIVAFAEVEKFLDTPVKRYSSGMYVRLAFAVAAHLEPEILIVDEVLAVGDTQFQKKCLGKMEDVSKEGRTILFVTHNMATLTQLCTKAIYLNQGKVKCLGDVNSIVSRYLTSDTDNKAYKKLDSNQDKPIFFKEFSVVDHEGKISSEIDVRHPFRINLIYEVTDLLQDTEISVRIETHDVRAVFTTNQSDCNPEIYRKRNLGIYQASIEIPSMFLMPGSYFVTIGAHQPMVQFFDHYDHILSFNINETGTKLAKYSKYSNHSSMGIVMVDIPWENNHLATV
jgi:lipopolysaccharide transport system ATP-binding protein